VTPPAPQERGSSTTKATPTPFGVVAAPGNDCRRVQVTAPSVLFQSPIVRDPK